MPCSIVSSSNSSVECKNQQNITSSQQLTLKSPNGREIAKIIREGVFEYPC